MKYNPEKHHRRSIRLKGYDYTSPGAYFITICTYQRECLFGEVISGEMQLNEFGIVAQDHWQKIPNYFPKIQLDAFIVMPNHIHGIVWIKNIDVDSRDIALPRVHDRKFGKPIADSLSTVVGSFKSATTKRINVIRNVLGISIWQSNYYEHIIRNNVALQHIQQYVHSNPFSWQQDQLHPANPSKW